MKVLSSSIAFTILLVASGTTAWSQSGVENDKWQTEVFANIATVELGKLVRDIQSEPLETTIARHFLAGQFRGSFADGESAEQLIAPFAISRRAGRIMRTDQPVKLVDRLKSQWQGVLPRDCEFKVVGVTPKDSTVTTKLLVAARSGLWEQHAEWNVVWAPSAKGNPRIVEWHIGEERSAALRESENTLFVDHTNAVFADVESYHQQLSFGQPHWLRRIEAFHGMLNPGQNGISVGDLDGDGFDDVYVCQPGGLPNRIYVRRKSGELMEGITIRGLDFLDNTHSALIVDLDNDGDQDVVLATQAAVLFCENSRGQFTLRHADRNMSDAYSLAASDYDRDGDIDVYACGYFPNGADVHVLPVPLPYFNANNGGTNRLLRNEGDWTFADVTDSVGLNADNRRFSYAVIWTDFDNDGDEDLYVANDFGPDVVYRSETVGGTIHFENVGTDFGIEHGAFGMSAAAHDVNRDGYEDIYVANMFSSAGNRVTRQPQFRPQNAAAHRILFQRLANGNSMLLNRSGRQFHDVGATSGTAMGRWSWGSNFTDLNNDGWQDLLVTNGYITGESTTDL